MIELHLLDPVDHLASRLLVPDAAGLVAERLQAQGIARLGAAFRGLGPGGRRLLERLPELDAWLAAVTESQPTAAAGERRLRELLEERGGGGLSPIEFRASLPSPEIVASVMALGAGLVIGVVLLDERSEDPLSQPLLDLDGALAALEERSLDLGLLTSVSPAETALGLATVVERLTELDARLGLQLRALGGLAEGARACRPASARRLHLLAGLVGAGIILPRREEEPRDPRPAAPLGCSR